MKEHERRAEIKRLATRRDLCIKGGDVGRASACESRIEEHRQKRRDLKRARRASVAK